MIEEFKCTDAESEQKEDERKELKNEKVEKFLW